MKYKERNLIEKKRKRTKKQLICSLAQLDPYLFQNFEYNIHIFLNEKPDPWSTFLSFWHLQVIQYKKKKIGH
jgi:hypothetical protein